MKPTAAILARNMGAIAVAIWNHTADEPESDTQLATSVLIGWSPRLGIREKKL